MNRIASCRCRSDSMMPLIPSPGSPNTTSTPHLCNTSTSTSAAVFAIFSLAKRGETNDSHDWPYALGDRGGLHPADEHRSRATDDEPRNGVHPQRQRR